MSVELIKGYKSKIEGFFDLIPQPAHRNIKSKVLSYRPGKFLYNSFKNMAKED